MESLDQLVRKHMRAAYAVALSVVRCPHDAEEIAQDSLLVAMERVGECDPARFSGWLLRIVRNRALNAFGFRTRREAAHQRLAHFVEGAANDDHETRAALRNGLRELSARDRQIVVMHDVEGWTHGEIAEALKLSPTNCRQTLFRARQRLRRRLEDGR